MSRSFTFAETSDQVRWLAAHRDVLDRGTLVAAAPEAAYACQQAGLAYARLEDFTTKSDRRPEYREAVTEFVSLQDGLDRWARASIPLFDRGAFRPAEGAAFRLQRLHGEIWATGRSLAEFFDAVDPTTINVWPRRDADVPLHLEPAGSPTLALVADVATVRGVPIRTLAGDEPTRPATGAPSAGTLSGRARAALLESWVRVAGAALRSGGIGDALRALAPPRLRGRRVLGCGFGYDVQRVMVELRRAGVGVFQVSNRLHQPHDAQHLLAELFATTPALVANAALWAPIEAAGAGRTRLWEGALVRWWTELVPSMWASYLVAERDLRDQRIDAVVVSDLGSADFGSMARQAGSAVGIPTYLYQHGGSADLDSPSLLPWVRGTHRLFLYGAGTRSDLATTLPPAVGPTAELLPVGSATIDELDVKGRRGRHGRLRRRLSAGDPRPLVLYAPTHFAPYFRAVSQLADHPVVPYFEMLQRVLSVFAESDRVRLVFKSFHVANDATRLMPELVRATVPDAVVTTTSLRELMWAVDAIVVDHVITATSEVLLTDAPCLFYMPSTSPQSDESRRLLRAAATVEESADAFIAALRRLVRTGTIAPIRSRDRSFLKAYATHLDDTHSARRAATLVAEPRATAPRRDS